MLRLLVKGKCKKYTGQLAAQPLKPPTAVRTDYLSKPSVWLGVVFGLVWSPSPTNQRPCFILRTQPYLVYFVGLPFLTGALHLNSELSARSIATVSCHPFIVQSLVFHLFQLSTPKSSWRHGCPSTLHGRTIFVFLCKILIRDCKLWSVTLGALSMQPSPNQAFSTLSISRIRQLYFSCFLSVDAGPFQRKFFSAVLYTWAFQLLSQGSSTTSGKHYIGKTYSPVVISARCCTRNCVVTRSTSLASERAESCIDTSLLFLLNV